MKYPKAILLTIALGVLVHTAIAFVPGRVMMPIFVIMAWKTTAQRHRRISIASFNLAVVEFIGGRNFA